VLVLDHDPDYSTVPLCSPRACSALRYFLYGKEDKLNVTRIKDLVSHSPVYSCLFLFVPLCSSLQAKGTQCS